MGCRDGFAEFILSEANVLTTGFQSLGVIPLLNELRGRIAAYLSQHRVCILSTRGCIGAWAMPVWYSPRAPQPDCNALEVECVLPRWADAAFHLQQNPQVLLIVHDLPSSLPPAGGGELVGGLRWLQYRGIAQLLESPDWPRLLPAWARLARPEELYCAVRIQPQRIDLIDESRGWGARDTLEL